MALLGDDEMIMQADIDSLEAVIDLAGHGDILFRRCWVAAGVIMGKDHRLGFQGNRLFQNFPSTGGCNRYRCLRR